MYSELIERCEADLRLGQATRVLQTLKALNLSLVPRAFRLPLANLSRRAGLFTVGLRLLTPLVHGEKVMTPPTQHELAEYAVLLLKSGAVDEAMTRITKVEKSIFPEAPLYKAFCHMAKWDYDLCIPELKAYSSSGVSGYSALVGKVNLASALIIEDRLNEAADLLDEITPLAGQGQYHRLRANCLELRTQVYLEENRNENAIESLNEAANLLQSSRTADQLFLLKWRAVLSARKSKAIGAIVDFKKEALARGHWESVREADFQALLIQFDQERFRHLLIGTPYESYRCRLGKKLGVSLLADTYVVGDVAGPRMDLQSGYISHGIEMKPGKKIHQTIELLLRDFYRPVGIATLFGQLFPDEQFNVLTSPNRVHQLVSRVRRFFKDNEIPVALDRIGSGFSMKVEGSFAFQVKLRRERVAGAAAQLERLRTFFEDRFSAVDARRILGVSEASMRRILNEALQLGQVQRVGIGRASRYRFQPLSLHADNLLQRVNDFD